MGGLVASIYSRDGEGIARDEWHTQSHYRVYVVVEQGKVDNGMG